MTVIVHIGRRVPKSWFRRQASRVSGLISFQENIWQMLKQSMSLAKRKCNESGKGTWVMTREVESEDMNYNLEWLKILITGNEEFEKEEYEEAQKLYEPFDKIFKKDIQVDKNMSKYFKSKILSNAKVDEAYAKGYGAIHNNNISNKLLEMGILTHIEWQKDYDIRKNDIKPDF